MFTRNTTNEVRIVYRCVNSRVWGLFIPKTPCWMGRWLKRRDGVVGEGQATRRLVSLIHREKESRIYTRLFARWQCWKKHEGSFLLRAWEREMINQFGRITRRNVIVFICYLLVIIIFIDISMSIYWEQVSYLFSIKRKYLWCLIIECFLREKHFLVWFLILCLAI